MPCLDCITVDDIWKCARTSTVASPKSDLYSDICFTDFCSPKSLGFLHVNTRSVLPKMDQLKVLVHSFNPDVLVITETWLRKSVLNTDVNLSVRSVLPEKV